MNYYSFHIGDYIKSTMHLTEMEDLAYRRLMDRYYDTEKPLDSDIENLCRLVRMKNYQNEVENILKEFFKETKNGWIQKRVEKEITSYRAKADTARANGKLGGRPKKTQQEPDRNPGKTQLVNDRNPEKTGSKAPKNQEPRTKTKNQDIDFSILDITQEELSELKRIRKKNKGGTLTERVIKSLAKEIQEAKNKGWSVDEILTEWEDRGWKSFRAEWINKKQGQNGGGMGRFPFE